MPDQNAGSSRSIYIATTMRQRFDLYCSEHGLDPRATKHVRDHTGLLGVRGGELIVLPDFMDDWPDLVAYARMHEMEVQVV